MEKLVNLGMKPKLLALFLLVGVVPLLVIGFLAERRAADFQARVVELTTQELEEQAFKQLVASRDVKKHTIEAHFAQERKQARTFAESHMAIEAARAFRDAFRVYPAQSGLTAETPRSHLLDELTGYYRNEFGSVYRQETGRDISLDADLSELDDEALTLQLSYIARNGHAIGSKHRLDRDPSDSDYARFHAHYHPVFRSYLETFGYYDIFLCDPDTGDIVYSVFKEIDFATSLRDGPFASTSFGHLYRQLSTSAESGTVMLVDSEPYAPSYEAAASFLAAPVFDEDELLALLVFQLPIDKITSVMNERAGLGDTGETYLVGPDGGLRSESLRHRGASEIATVSTQRGLEGLTGAVSIEDAAGRAGHSADTPLDLRDGLRGIQHA
ncbi:MAG: hypothetical protein AAF533_25310, partial [Acidobacteriota bacterium]